VNNKTAARTPGGVLILLHNQIHVPVVNEETLTVKVNRHSTRYLVSRLGQLSFAVKKHADGTFQAKERPPTFVGGQVFALPLFAVRASIVLPSASVRWTLAGRKKPQPFG